MLITLAPLSAAQMMPVATSAKVPLPLSSSTLTLIQRALRAGPGDASCVVRRGRDGPRDVGAVTDPVVVTRRRREVHALRDLARQVDVRLVDAGVEDGDGDR